MITVREWKLVLACLITALSMTGSSSASPTAPKLPSTLNFQPLNVIAAPQTEADWQFEMSHLDMVVASDHLAGLRQRNSDMCCLQYELLHTTQISDTAEQSALASYAAAHGYNEEDAYLHWYDDTNFAYNEGGKTGFVRGYGGGSASTLKEARMLNNIWGQDRYILNLKSPLVRGYRGEQYRQVLVSGNKPDGIFVDETSPFFTFVPSTSSGGHIREYGNRNRTDADADWMNDVNGAFAAVNAAMLKDSPFGDHYLMPNVAEYYDMFTNLGTSGADGVATEVMIQEISPRAPRYFDLAKQFANAGKVFIMTQAGYGPMVNEAGNYSSALDRHQMYGLTDYWIAKQGLSTYYGQFPSGYVTLSQFWCKARDYDVGTPIDGLYATWKTGTDSAGQAYTIYKREYTKALMLTRPQPGWTYTNYGARSQLYDLGGTYKLLHWDGTLGPNITQIGIAMGEAVTLIKDGVTPPSDTTPPVISNVNLTNVTMNSASATWATNESATGVVDYGASTSYGSSASASNSGLSQSVALSNLTASTTYHYRITATDTAGNKTVSPDYTFTTAAPASSPQITIVISADKTSAKSGDTIIYTVTYKNIGSGAANSVVVTADVDPNVNFASASNSGSYDSTARVVRWSVGTLQAAATNSVTYTVTVK